MFCRTLNTTLLKRTEEIFTPPQLPLMSLVVVKETFPKKDKAKQKMRI